MSKFSVKKPFTVLVGVIVAIVLGVVSMTKMQLDLLPNISLPYLLVITTYPGASPEKVETDICIPMERALGTINGVENVTSICNENYGMVQLEFAEGTNMDSAMVKVSSALNTMESLLPDDCGTPSIMELGTDLMASVYLAVSMEGMEIDELSQFVSDNVTPTFERQDGVASVTALGLVDKTVQVELNEEKIAILNDKILATTDDAFADAVEQLDDAKKQLEESAETIEESKEKLTDSQNDLYDGIQDLLDAQEELDKNRGDLAQNEIDLDEGLEKVNKGLDALGEAKGQANSGFALANEGINGWEKLIKAKTDLAPIMSSLSALGDNPVSVLPSDKKEILSQSLGPFGITIEDTDTGNELISKINGVIDGGIEKAKTELAKAGLDTTSPDAARSSLKALEATTGVTFDLNDYKLSSAKTQLESAQKQLESGRKQLKSAQEQIDDGWDQLADGQQQIWDGWDDLAEGEEKLADGWDDYYDAVKSYEKQKAEALKKANANDLIKLETLASLIYAQNFEMPAGYIDDKLDDSWLVKVGQNYEEVSELEDVVLCNIHNVGDVKLGDVADIYVIDNADDSYVRLGTDKGVILSVFKSSTAGTNDVSKSVQKGIEELKEEYPGIKVMVLTDQGDYINLIVKSVLQSMAIGALLAIIILAIFLRDTKPTMVVAISIPLSVFAAIICMYFSDISLNMLSLSGLALGIGMLVDNSIVVIENIYRLRGRGVEAPRAAVQGTKQVAGAITSSTLTTACVFLPMIYTTGLVNELMAPMCLTIVYCLMASLFVAMTVVPAASSTLLRKAQPKDHPLFDKIQDAYGVALDFCLKRKWIPMLTAIALLFFTGWLVVRMGVVMLPEMTMNTIEADIEYSEELSREECYRLTDEVNERLSHVEGIGSIGVMAGDDTTLMTQDLAGSASVNFRQMSYIVLTENPDAGEEEIKKIMRDMEAAVADMDIDFQISTASSEMDSMMGGSGLNITIYGDDLDTLLDISHDVMDIVGTVEGFTEVSNGEEDADQVIHVIIDKNKAMSMGLSVAQVYQEIAGKIDNTESSVTITVDGIDMGIEVVDNIDELMYENLMDYTFTVDTYDEDDDQVTKDVTLGEFATIEINDGVSRISRENQSRYMTVSASAEEGYNVTLLSRELEPLIDAYELPSGYIIEMGGEYDSVMTMIEQMLLVIALGALFIYLVMVAQFQSLLSPFIVIFTIPLAFTGGFLSLWLTRENLSALSLMGFVVLMGTVVNNGIVFVDYTNQLRMGGMERRDALIATGKTRMRPILMTALTTILAESNLIMGDDMGAQLGKGMALVIAGGLAYATLMTLFIIPIMYDILFKKAPLNVDTGSEDLDDLPDDAEEFMAEIRNKNNGI